jgi:hypothetical protein
MFLTSHSVKSHNLNSIQISRERTNIRLNGQVDWNQEKKYEENEDVDEDERPHDLSNLDDLFGMYVHTAVVAAVHWLLLSTAFGY